MSRKIAIENFLKMTPEAPQYSDKNQHYLISGANPTYYLDDTNTQEQQVAPLIAVNKWAGDSASTIDGTIVHMIASTEGTYALYAITSTTKVYGLSGGIATDLGYPSGSSVANVGGRLAIAGGILFATWTGLRKIYKMTQPSSAWTSFGTPGTEMHSTNGFPFLEPFLDFIAVADNASGAVPNNLLLRIDVSAFIIGQPPTINTLDLGYGWGITGLANYNNKYLAVSAGRTKSAGTVGYPQNYIFLWNGTSSTYQYAVKVTGEFLDMKVVDGTLYVAVAVSSTKTVLYYLYNTVLREVFNPQYSTITSSVAGGSGVNNCIFNFQNNVGIRLDATTDIPIYPMLMLYGKQAVGQSEFIFSTGKFFDQFCVGYDGILYASIGGGTFTFYSVVNTAFLNIKYKSHWIPVNNLKAIDIYYETPPASGTDAINVTIDGEGEDILAGNSTTALMSITPTSYLNKKRTRLDLKGFTGSQVRITLSTVNTGTWRPIIRAINLIEK